MRLNDPVVERHDGIIVVREDLCCDELASGKLRGLLPWFAELRTAGVRGVVNHGVSYSNSHAIVGYAARAAGLSAVSYVNCKYTTPQTELAASFGVRMIYSGPKQLGPLRSHAKRHAEGGFRQLPWALIHPRPLEFVAAMAAVVLPRLGKPTVHVVPIGGGGYAAAVAAAVRGLGTPVVGVTAAGTLSASRRRLDEIRPFHRIAVEECPAPAATPFPSDPNYEHNAWPAALRLRDAGERVAFWSVGVSLCESR